MRFSLALRFDGSIAAWGDNTYGQCTVPEPNADFIAISAGYSHSLGLKADGSIAAWGNNYCAQCNVPAPNSGFVTVAGGGCHSLGLKADGAIVAWGDNFWDQCSVPTPNTDFIAVAAGSSHSLGLKSDGSVVAWGRNNSGQCNVPEPNSGFIAITAHGLYGPDGNHSLGLKADGSTVAWGFGPLNVPTPNSDFVAVAWGGRHSLGLKSDGSVVAWGLNNVGQCNVPAPNAGFTAIAAGPSRSLGLKAEGATPPTTDFDGNGAVDLADYEYLEPCITGPTTGSFNGGCSPGDFGFDLDIDLGDFSKFQMIFGSNLADTDEDRIPDVFETNDGQFVSSAQTDTNPNNPDTDGDSIKDGDEVYGAVNGLALRFMGAKPLRKDIFVEIDWVNNNGTPPARNRPHSDQKERIVEAFENAPINNPDGSSGITLHLDVGQAPYGGGNYAGDYPILNTTNPEFAGDFLLIKNGDATHQRNFSANRNGYFHYAVSCDRYSIDGGAARIGGVAELPLPGDDFIVAAGGALDDGASTNDDQVGSVIMHELGHNLGLHHGGDECVNNKPNYNSIMNYRYAYRGVDATCDAEGDNRTLDFSVGDRIELVQSSLNECQGVCGDGFPIDWNSNGVPCETGVSRHFTAPEEGCFDVPDDYPLHDYDDWAHLRFGGIFEPDRSAPEIVTCHFGPPP